MIQTIRDAEIKVSILERDVIFLKTQINDLKTKIELVQKNIKNANGNSSTPVNPVDSIPTADGTTILHRVIHVFEKLKATTIEVSEKITANIIEVTQLILANLHLTGTLQVEGNTTLNTFQTVGDAQIGGNLSIANTSGTGGVSFRFDGYMDSFYMVADGSPGKIGFMTNGVANLQVGPENNVIIKTPPGFATGNLFPGSCSISLNEGTNQLGIFVKYTGGTVKVGVINLT